MKTNSSDSDSMGIKVPEKHEFKGYDLNELRYQRALLFIKKEFLKEKALNDTMAIKQRIPIVNGKSPISGMSPTSLVGRVVKGLNYADYLMLGFTAFNAGKKLFSIFRKKK